MSALSTLVVALLALVSILLPLSSALPIESDYGALTKPNTGLFESPVLHQLPTVRSLRRGSRHSSRRAPKTSGHCGDGESNCTSRRDGGEKSSSKHSLLNLHVLSLAGSRGDGDDGDDDGNSGNSDSDGNSDSNSSSNSGGYATYYYQENSAGACGSYHGDSDLVAAMDIGRYGDINAASSLCGTQVHITNNENGRSVVVTIADACPDCRGRNSIDLSVSAFQEIAPESEGMVPITWAFVG
ncbi:hypothetical protein BOTBODRAFT_61389 [Botryobasidium botryosum FD-172 SS1]|uniref:RlpA-like protein double-psi beta-barrel domain-containing protein n=1 Tax=Botryobasidium botryosum (strain FD-172 SS1) TaxID=930990 RepID=A0A067N484_BOTB1|nr:hypothetical protein BOTBODRAFT_61389 [Botryobasidium botryosum FD-172 SS1]